MQPDVTDAQVGIGIGVCRQCEYQADAKSRAHAFLENNPKSCARSIAFYALVEEISRADMGSMMGFAHHSFQEFLTARYLLGDLDISSVTACCDEYLGGSDWWQEVLYFYIDLAGKPQETLQWIDERLKVFTRYSGAKSAAAKERALLLKQHLADSFPYAKC